MSTDSLETLASISGPIYASVYFSTIMTTAFYGVACMQTFFYYVHYRNDRLRMKVFVAIIWALNTIHEALTVAGAYKYIMAGMVNPESFLNGDPDFTLQIFPSALVGVLTQAFLMHRIYIFSGKRIITFLLWFVPATLQLVLSTYYISRVVYSANGSLYIVNISVLNDKTLTTTITLSLVAAAGEDILIAIVLVFLLIRTRTSTRFANTAHMLQRLTIFAVNTGTWTATFGLLALIFVQVLPSKLIYVVFAVPICPVYANTLLANLNVRAYLADGSRAGHVSADLISSATLDSSGQRRETKLVFSTPGAVRRPAELTTVSDTNAALTTSEDV